MADQVPKAVVQERYERLLAGAGPDLRIEENRRQVGRHRRGPRGDRRGQEGRLDPPAVGPCRRQPARALRGARRVRRPATRRRRHGDGHSRRTVPPARRRVRAGPKSRCASVARAPATPGTARRAASCAVPSGGGCATRASLSGLRPVERSRADRRHAHAATRQSAHRPSRGSSAPAPALTSDMNACWSRSSVPPARASPPSRWISPRRSPINGFRPPRSSTPTRCSSTGAWTSARPSFRSPSGRGIAASPRRRARRHRRGVRSNGIRMRRSQGRSSDVHRRRGAVPILVGGSGLYVSSVLYDFRFPGTRRSRPASRYEASSPTHSAPGALYDSIDPATASIRSICSHGVSSGRPRNADVSSGPSRCWSRTSAIRTAQRCPAGGTLP